MTTDTGRVTDYVIHALPAKVLSEARARALDTPDGHDDLRVLAATGGEPLRCCLRDAEPGERLMLFNFRPPLPEASPYQETGAVFAHADAADCEGAEPSGYPEGWRGRRQVLRAYDARGFIHPATRVHDGTDPGAVIDEIFSDPDVVLVHSRNVAYGCYMFAIERG